ncbi:MAG: hypothetical protein EHM89_11495, partial [Acidobacteria bacterium]
MTRHDRWLLPTAVNSWSSRGPTPARSRSSISLVAAAAGALLIAACATNPATGKREISLMSEAQEIELGREADVEVQREMGLYEDRALQEY